jgi:hypothetical protein
MTPVIRSRLAITAACFFGVATCANVTHARGGYRVRQAQEIRSTDTGDLEVLELRSNFFMIAGAGGHIGVQVGDDGVVVVDLFHIPREAVLGGADTLYPEYRKKIKDTYVRPEPCKRDCGAPPLR